MAEYLILRDASGTWQRGDSPGAGCLGAPVAISRTKRRADPDISVAELDGTGLDELCADPSVLSIAPVMPTRLVSPEPLDDIRPEDVVPLWGLRETGALDCAYDGTGVTIALLDTGIDAKHPAFSGVSPVFQDFVGSGMHDDHGHGTHCAASILGRPLKGYRLGVATGIDAPLIGKVIADYGRGTSAMLFHGLQWALENGAAIIFLPAEFDTVTMSEALAASGHPARLAASVALNALNGNLGLMRTLLMLHQAGRDKTEAPLIVVPAGNNSRRTISPELTTAGTPMTAVPGVISVGALGYGEDGLTLASFSDLCPTLVAPGVGILSAAADSNLRALNGTTMAAACAAALWLQAQGEKRFVTRMLASARNTGMPGGQGPWHIGAGLVQAPR
ncbi:S8 family serine peptidase [Aestuariicoccus sp. MJ-SS9]|uniref:S8 family serine peptidase n=1 Tax=Aestuariicoccus sp. MJ-SS9 TaxID=3079855 RepID=UPI00290A144C|nr:S8 family serine peptidase [Aestuariicoccus sp. MJ-SS9]MDU8910172.1 S8 family serine peptidase [Aestuariicoccus sp. MJ-SS9]